MVLTSGGYWSKNRWQAGGTSYWNAFWLLPANKVASNAFTGVCLLFFPRVGTSHASWDRSHIRIPFPQPSDLGTYPPPLDIRPGDLPPSPRYQTWGIYPFLLLLTSGGDHWRPVHLRTYPPTGTDTYRYPPKHIRLTSGWYASYWTDVLLKMWFECPYWPNTVMNQ